MAYTPCVVVQRRNPSLSCCGIILDTTNGIVLTVASLFGDLLPLNDTTGRCWVDASDDRFAVEVLIESNRCCQEFRTLHVLHGFAFFFWRVEELQRLEEQIFPSSEWKFESLDLVQTRELKSVNFTDARYIRNQNALSGFVLIRVKKLGSYQSCKAVDLVTLRNSSTPVKGDTVWIIGTPFGSECPSVFYNSITKGIISNLVGGHREVIITDARCVPGCEGCLLYINSQAQNSFDLSTGSFPYAIVLVPFCWRNGEWTGITIACSLKFLMNSLLKIMGISMLQLPLHLEEVGLDVCNSVVPCDIDNNYRQEKDQDDKSPVVCSLSGPDAFSGVVLVQRGFSWGSGIVVDAEEGLVATCGHVVRSPVVSGDDTLQHHTPSGAEVKVSVDFPNGAWQDAQVLYASKKDCPLDFALLKVDCCPVQQASQCRGSRSVELISSLYKSGEDVFIMGFPLFASHLNIGPSIASGVLSKVVYIDNLVVMLQASAAVQCGSSGGALVSSKTGELLGMITSHVRDAKLTSTFPHINFSIPYTLLHKLVLAVKSNSIDECIMSLVSYQMKNIWQLRYSLDEQKHVASKL